MQFSFLKPSEETQKVLNRAIQPKELHDIKDAELIDALIYKIEETYAKLNHNIRIKPYYDTQLLVRNLNEKELEVLRNYRKGCVVNRVSKQLNIFDEFLRRFDKPVKKPFPENNGF